VWPSGYLSDVPCGLQYAHPCLKWSSKQHCCHCFSSYQPMLLLYRQPTPTWSFVVRSFIMIQAAIFRKMDNCCARSFRTAAVSMATSRWLYFLCCRRTVANVSTPRSLVTYADCRLSWILYQFISFYNNDKQ